MDNVIFDKDATVVIAKETSRASDSVSVVKKESSKKKSAKKIQKMNVQDALENLASYNMPQFRPFTMQGSGLGECAFCGTITSSSHRKVCGECMKKERESLYEKLMDAISNHEDSIQL